MCCKSGWHVVGMQLVYGQYVIHMWLVCVWHVVGMQLVYGQYVVNMWLVCVQYVGM